MNEPDEVLWYWRLRWYEDVFRLALNMRILPRECAEASPSSTDRTKRLLSERLGRPVESLSDLTTADWQQAVEALEAHFGLSERSDRPSGERP